MEKLITLLGGGCNPALTKGAFSHCKRPIHAIVDCSEPCVPQHNSMPTIPKLSGKEWAKQFQKCTEDSPEYFENAEMVKESTEMAKKRPR